jgi:hypothetical protein
MMSMSSTSTSSKHKSGVELVLPNQRLLTHRAPVEEIVQAVQAGKLKIDVLQNVLVAFFDAAETVDFGFAKLAAAQQSGTVDGWAVPIFFIFDERRWRANVEHTVTRHVRDGQAKSELVYFINVNLPNDGYMYNANLGDAQELLNSTTNEEVAAFVKSVAAVIGPHLAASVAFGEPGDTLIEYLNEDGRVRWNVWNQANTHCLSLRWEYGHRDGIVRKGEARAAQEKQAADLGDLWKKHFKVGKAPV